MTKQTLPARNEVPLEEKWNLESIFPTVEDWNFALQEVERRLSELAEYQGRLNEGPETLVTYLNLAESINRMALKVMVYAALDASTDVSLQDAVARAGQGRSLMAKTAAARSFEEPELMEIGFEQLQQWAGQDPALAVYMHYFEDLERQAAHVRSAEVEELLAMTMDPMQPSTPYTSLVNSEMKFEPAVASDGSQLEVGQTSIDDLKTHPDREVRRSAYASYAEGYLAFKNTLAGTQTMAFQRDVFNARARRYDSALLATLDPHNIPEQVFHNLIDVFKRNLPTWHKYWRIRRKALGVDKLYDYDAKAPLSEEKVHIPYEQAVDWICEGMAPLGDEYVQVLRDGCTVNRWVDRARNKGKRQGAFSWGSYDTQPFIMMSYDSDVFSLSTLAHELGHSMHTYNSCRTQPFIYGRYSLFAAEVASNFNQALTRDYLFETQDDPVFQLSLIEEAMSNYHRYFFIMPTLARWELEMHQRVEKGAPVNAQILSECCADLFGEGFGEDVEYNRDHVGIIWAQFQHMYMNFYVYQYATGISGAHALAHRVVSGEQGAVDDYLGFLKAGSSMYPLDALKKAGVDLRDPEPVERAFAVLADIVDRLEKLVG